MIYSLLRVCAFLLTVTVALRGGDSTSIASLQGLGAVAVIVEDIDSEIEQAGLHRSDIQTDVELKLRLAGVKVNTTPESAKQPGSPALYVNANVILSHSNPQLVLYTIDCELRQWVLLARDPSILVMAASWSKSMLGTAGTNHLQGVRDHIKDQVDKFLNDYLSVNPKK